MNEMTGKDIDALVEERIFGRHAHSWKRDYATVRMSVCESCGARATGGQTYIPNAYSTSIAAAWSVVGELRSSGWTFELSVEQEDFDQACQVVFSKPGRRGASEQRRVPLAICLAALKAVGVEVPV